MGDILITNAINSHRTSQYSNNLVDIFIHGGVVQEIGSQLSYPNAETVIDAAGKYIATGFLDMHVHIGVPGLTQYQGQEMGVDIDKFGIQVGVGTLVDAGTFGADRINQAIEISEEKDTDVYFLMNASRIGLQPLTAELENLENIDIDAAEKAYARDSDRIVGIKARMSESASGKAGIHALVKAKALSSFLGLPLVVHIGHAPPEIEEVLAVLTTGDIVTHCFHGKLANAIVDEKYHLRPSTIEARNRGILFDIGHGSESFNFQVAQHLFNADFLPDMISTDLHSLNANGPVLSLPITVDKFISLNGSLQPWLDMATIHPRKALGLSPANLLEEGSPADLILFQFASTEATYSDSDGNPIHVQKQVQVSHVIKPGKTFVLDHQ